MPEGYEKLGTFSLTRSGPFYRVEERLGLAREGFPGLALRTAIATGVTFLPLVVLAAIEGVLIGSRVTLPLLHDLTVYARFAFAVPLLLHAEQFVDTRLSMAVTHFQTGDILEGRARDDFEAALDRLRHALDSRLPEIILLLVAMIPALVHNRTVLGHPVSSWQVLSPGLSSTTTWAGKWLEFVSLPIFSFLILRWLWRILLWSQFLWRVSRIDLRLIPTHPDGSGGLAFLGLLHTAFGAFLVPVAATIAARGVQWVQIGGGTIGSLRNVLIAFIVIGLGLALGPLLLFIPKLIAIKRRGLLEYAKVATDYTRDFDQKWLRKPMTAEEPMLGSSDIQSLADLGNSYSFIQRMRVIPVSRQNAIAIGVATALPMLPFLLLIFPLEQLLKQVATLVIR